MDQVRLAVIGCGAAAELIHLPAAAALDDVTVTMVVDQNRERAQAVAQRFQVPAAGQDYREVVGRADAAVLALPNSLHAPVAIDLLRAGVHVLVEKPMALRSEDCIAMIETAHRAGVVLAVGLEFRCFPPMQLVRKMVQQGWLGQLRRVEIRQGLVLRWPTRSDYLLRPEVAGGGVLVDFGSHIVDLLVWWLGDPEEVEYADDAVGGVEANGEIYLRFPGGTEAFVELSRCRKLRNTCVIEGTRGRLEVELWNPQGRIRLETEVPGLALYGTTVSDRSGTWEDAFRDEYRGFIGAIKGERPPVVSGEEGARSVRVIEACYRARRPLDLPWVAAGTGLSRGGKGVDRTYLSPLAGVRVCVTGATGFIGGRVVEKLVHEHRAQVRVLVRRIAKASRISRYPIEIVSGDITDPCAVHQVVEGCDLVIHCAYGNSDDAERNRLVTVQGTDNVFRAAMAVGRPRVVHVSTVAVYGGVHDGVFDENSPRRPSGDPYADAKLEAESLALHWARSGLPVVVVQPTVVYGPYGSTWTVNVLRRLQQTRQILVDGGEGLCNAVYVDDVADALILAGMAERAVGESFLISGQAPITWKEFFGRYEQMLGGPATVPMTAEEARAYYHAASRPKSIATELPRILREEPGVFHRLTRTREVMAIRGLLRRVLPPAMRATVRNLVMKDGQITARPPAVSLPIHPLNPRQIAFYAAKVRVRIDKARALLGYEPHFDFSRGMELTEAWVRWSNLIDAAQPSASLPSSVE